MLQSPPRSAIVREVHRVKIICITPQWAVRMLLRVWREGTKYPHIRRGAEADPVPAITRVSIMCQVFTRAMGNRILALVIH